MEEGPSGLYTYYPAPVQKYVSLVPPWPLAATKALLTDNIHRHLLYWFISVVNNERIGGGGAGLVSKYNNQPVAVAQIQPIYRPGWRSDKEEEV